MGLRMQEEKLGGLGEKRQKKGGLESQIRNLAFRSRKGGATEGSGGNQGDQDSHLRMLWR